MAAPLLTRTVSDEATLRPCRTLSILCARFSALNPTLPCHLITVEMSADGTVIIFTTGGARPTYTDLSITDLPSPRALIDGLVAVVIHAITNLASIGVDLRILIITVRPPVGAGPTPKTIPIQIDTLTSALMDTGTIPPYTVIIDVIAADFIAILMDARIGVIAIFSQAATPLSMPILISVNALLRDGSISPTAILIDPISRNIPSGGVDIGVLIVTIRPDTVISCTKAIMIPILTMLGTG